MTSNYPATNKTRHLIPDVDVARKLGCSRAHVWRMSREGRLPRPVKAGKMTTRWIESEIDAFIESLIADRDKASVSKTD